MGDFYVPDIILGAGEIAVNKTFKTLAFMDCKYQKGSRTNT